MSSTRLHVILYRPVARVALWLRNLCPSVAGMEQVHPRILGTTALDICSNSCDPLFPQVDLLTFNDLAERGCAHLNDNYAHDGMTATTTRVGTTINTMHLDESRSPFWSAQPPENPSNTPYCRDVSQFALAAAGQARQMEDADEEEEEVSLGRHIISPQNADRRCQALAKEISPLNVVRLGNAPYHGGTKGYEPLTMSIVHHCGCTEINPNCVILSYNDVIHLHDYVLENWEHPRGYFKGPHLERILEKGLQSFPCLILIDVKSSVEFYNAFHKTSFLYLLLVMPFDCISIKMGYDALCPPDLGLPRYAMIAWVLMELLP